MPNRLPVTRAEFRQALLVWITLVPPRVIKQLVRQTDPDRRRDPAAEVNDARAELASHLAGKLEQAEWEVTRPERGGIFEASGCFPAADTPR